MPSYLECTCLTCNEEFRGQVRNGRHPKYCSSKCYNNQRENKEKHNCSTCGKNFTARKGRIYCSSECYRNSTRSANPNTNKKCLYCEKPFKAYARKEKDGSTRRSKFCCLAHRDAYKAKHGKGYTVSKLTCRQCGMEFKAPAKTSSGERKFCSHKCYSLNKRGKMVGNKNPSYIDGSTPAANKRVKDAVWREIARMIRDRDYHTCQRCDMIAEDETFPVHHIIPYRKTQDDSPNNLITLCSICHGWAETHLEESIELFQKIRKEQDIEIMRAEIEKIIRAEVEKIKDYGHYKARKEAALE